MANFWDGGGEVHKINKFDMSKVVSRIERLKIATTISTRL
jgi:hypothetical protein